MMNTLIRYNNCVTVWGSVLSHQSLQRPLTRPEAWRDDWVSPWIPSDCCLQLSEWLHTWLHHLNIWTLILSVNTFFLILTRFYPGHFAVVPLQMWSSWFYTATCTSDCCSLSRGPATPRAPLLVSVCRNWRFNATWNSVFVPICSKWAVISEQWALRQTVKMNVGINKHTHTHTGPFLPHWLSLFLKIKNK